MLASFPDHTDSMYCSMGMRLATVYASYDIVHTKYDITVFMLCVCVM